MKENKPLPIKVLLLTHEYGRRITGGLGRVVNGLFKRIPDKIALDIFQIKFPFPAMIDTTRSYTIEERKDIAYLYRKTDQNKVKCLLNAEYKEVLNNILSDEKYDIAHVIVNSSIMSECLKEIKNKFPQIKTVYSCHSMAKYEIGVRNNYQEELIHEDYIFNNVDYVHLLNGASVQYLKKCYADVAKKEHVFVIPNGIEEEDFADIDNLFKRDLLNQVRPDKNKIVLCLTRWSFGKGLEYLLDAVPYVLKELKNVKFIIAGRKTYSWENNVREYVKIIDEKIEPLRENVISLGWLENPLRNAIFSLADICVMPSLLEYFPYGILEPVVCKVPVISSKIESVEELLIENQECLFYSPTNSKELAEKIIYLIKNDELRKSLASSAFKKVNENYNWQTICKMYEDMYQKIRVGTTSACPDISPELTIK